MKTLRQHLALLVFLAASALRGSCAVQVVPVDPLDRVFPDARPAAQTLSPIHVPRGGSACFQFAVWSEAGANCSLRVDPGVRPGGRALAASATIYRLAPVHVEANNQAAMKTIAGGKPPEAWLPYLLRPAPFDVCEVLTPAAEVKVEPGCTEAVLVEMKLAQDALAGEYAGTLVLECKGAAIRAPFALQVHDVALSVPVALDCVHWLDPQPTSLVAGPAPAWWSEEHWKLLENAGRALRTFGDNTMFTPLINYRQPLIQTRRAKDGSYHFDYARFDRWIETFSRLGYVRFTGQHAARLPQVWGGVSVRDEQTGNEVPMPVKPGDVENWLQFLPVFYDSLSQHSAEKHWTQRYWQHQLDEPRDLALYARMASLLREHLPGVRSIDAINAQPRNFSPMVDVHVFNLPTLAQCQSALVKERMQQGRSIWLYHCASPYPPSPNRHLDAALSESRLYPWLCSLLHAEGFLYWAANMYRGADEYRSSIGPLPNGSQNPGHPPGDNWMFYRGPEGLLGSLRMVAFREGLTDHALLTELGRLNPVAAKSIVASVVNSPTDYAREPSAYHAARRLLLEALENEAKQP